MEFKRTEIEVKVYGGTHKLRLPTFRHVAEYRAAVKEAGSDEMKLADGLITFLERLGLPKDVSEDLEVDHLAQLANFILEKKAQSSPETTTKSAS